MSGDSEGRGERCGGIPPPQDETRNRAVRINHHLPTLGPLHSMCAPVMLSQLNSAQASVSDRRESTRNEETGTIAHSLNPFSRGDQGNYSDGHKNTFRPSERIEVRKSHFGRLLSKNCATFAGVENRRISSAHLMT